MEFFSVYTGKLFSKKSLVGRAFHNFAPEGTVCDRERERERERERDS